MWKYSNNDEIFNRIIDEGHYIVENRATIRQTAAAFNVSKSTVYKDVTERLTEYNPVLAKDVSKVLAYNKAARYSRGGISTIIKHGNPRKIKTK
ncbi:MAG: stage III sporulation protein D [Clostridiales bacterium]|nr:stage III sporulation protein D [Clostridiales bacterium]